MQSTEKDVTAVRMLSESNDGFVRCSGRRQHGPCSDDDVGGLHDAGGTAHNAPPRFTYATSQLDTVAWLPTCGDTSRYTGMSSPISIFLCDGTSTTVIFI